MIKKTTLVLMLCLLLTPSVGYSHHHHGDAALAWGLTGLFIGSMLTAAAYRPPVVYAAPPAVYRPPVYAYAPSVPPGSCRWERYVLDGYGRALLDPYGRPIKEYTIGPCDYPPPY
ncbi:hypothetical protein Despr_1175 [Desulfobulbus propionicus DSM 2032]|jgi:hypothetical protein|uniref:Uncharacterized protein n=1 Tax=Desulfobulbus propionicus (strain ATCC 33891 / DSM 2032 / VKM B-1956 / 1pr3) TaxID=577650 RepID=A0A7U3YL36_DESPD|nr:hypothetical protein [Desulfobulbus propionicus]ADW17345.1 hypothetical protein Despr_1175 [Desulfobulbus propionicus DSM 2032]